MTNPSFAVPSCLGAASVLAPVVSLDLGGALRHSVVPQIVEGNADAFPMPHMVEKSGHFCFRHQYATGASCKRGYTLTEHVRNSARVRQPISGWGACSVFFCAFQSLQPRSSMYSFPLTKAASCGGVQSLSALLRKLARANEAPALVSLINAFTLPLEARVRWFALGKALRVEVA